MNENIKQVGRFVIQYHSGNLVAISYMGIVSGLATQMLTNQKVKGVLKPTGTFCNLPFQGVAYPGIIFKKPLFMSRHKLENFLRTDN